MQPKRFGKPPMTADVVKKGIQFTITDRSTIEIMGDVFDYDIDMLQAVHYWQDLQDE